MGSLPEEVQQCIRWLAENPSDIELQAVVSNEAFQVWFQQYLEFRQSARDGKSGMTAQWWMMYIDKSWAINGLYKSVKTNDMKLRLQCLDGKINQLFFFTKSSKLCQVCYIPYIPDVEFRVQSSRCDGRYRRQGIQCKSIQN